MEFETVDSECKVERVLADFEMFSNMSFVIDLPRKVLLISFDPHAHTKTACCRRQGSLYQPMSALQIRFIRRIVHHEVTEKHESYDTRMKALSFDPEI